jgi:hypothetical protein
MQIQIQRCIHYNAKQKLLPHLISHRIELYFRRFESTRERYTVYGVIKTGKKEQHIITFSNSDIYKYNKALEALNKECLCVWGCNAFKDRMYSIIRCGLYEDQIYNEGF